MSNFDNYLADFAQSGKRHKLLPRLTASGKASGITAEDIIERARALGIHDRDRDIRKLWKGSKADPSNRSASFRPRRPSAPRLTREEEIEERRKSLDPRLRQFVPVTLREYWKTSPAGHTTIVHIDQSIRMTDGELHLDDRAYRRQAAKELRDLFRPGDLIWAGFFPKGGYKTAFDGRSLRNGGGIVEAYDLSRRIEDGRVFMIPTHISLNPVTGESVEKPNTDGKGTHPSFNCKETVARYCHALLEIDGLFDIGADGVKIPSQAQIEIVAGLLDWAYYTEKLRVICAHHTGSKSIHTIAEVNASTADEYATQMSHLADVFASADDEKFRVDLAPFRNPATLVRLAGAIRPETGRRARLLYADDSFATPDFSTPPCGSAGGRGFCGVCLHLGECPFASKTAVRGTTIPATIKG